LVDTNCNLQTQVAQKTVYRRTHASQACRSMWKK